MAKRKKTATVKIDVTKHQLVPEHKLLSDKEKKILFETYNVSIKELPKIFVGDAAIQHLKPKPGDIIKVIKSSPTAGKTIYYRGVISE